MSIKLTIMGCGASGGVPTVGNNWGKCDPSNPKNRRMRCSIALQKDGRNVIVDTGSDFYYQVNRMDIKKVDAVIYSHAHADHIHGLDDLRVFYMQHREAVNIYGDKACINELEERFAYLFMERQGGIYPKVMEPHIIDESQFGQEIEIAGMPFVMFEQDHGVCKSLGIRIHDVAYSPDMIDIDQQQLEHLYGVKTWIVDANGYNFDKSRQAVCVHATLDDIYRLNNIVQAERVILTSISHFMDYETLLNETPDGYEPAYDGMVIDIA
jgi:phosphoribosyl 1,2-cyclic phosphate phosphodiesterase